MLSQEQMNQLLTTLQKRRVQDPRDARLLRLEAVVEVLYASGMRISELTGLDLQSVDRANKTVRVLGKGNKERVVPLGTPGARGVESLGFVWSSAVDSGGRSGRDGSVYWPLGVGVRMPVRFVRI